MKTNKNKAYNKFNEDIIEYFGVNCDSNQLTEFKNNISLRRILRLKESKKNLFSFFFKKKKNIFTETYACYNRIIFSSILSPEELGNRLNKAGFEDFVEFGDIERGSYRSFPTQISSWSSNALEPANLIGIVNNNPVYISIKEMGRKNLDVIVKKGISTYSPPTPLYDIKKNRGPLEIKIFGTKEDVKETYKNLGLISLADIDNIYKR